MSTPGVMTREEYREWCRSGAIPEHLRDAKPAPAVTGIEPVDDADRKGGDWSEWPEDLRVREFPR